MARDRLNTEKHAQNDGVGAAVGNFFKNIPGIKQIRKAIGQAANTQSLQSIYTMVPTDASVAPPPLSGSHGGAQLQNTSYAFNNPSTGLQETIQGYKLDAQPGKPTIIYFGGSEFDRDKDSYKTAMTRMAEEARKNGMGFVAYDYPSSPNENVIKAHVDQLSTHLEQQGIPKNQQAYSGYSLGGFSAMYAAKQNPDSAGLHVTSTFSSVRQATKEGINETLGAAGQLVPKTELTQIMDNVELADDIVALQNQRHQNGQGAMPINMVYSSGEDFGKAGNRHMTPLINRFNNYAGSKKVDVSPNPNADHMSMCTSQSNQGSFSDFTSKVNAYQQSRNIGVAPQVQAPQVQGPQVQVPQVQVPQVGGQQVGGSTITRPRSASVRSSIYGEGSSSGGTTKSVGLKSSSDTTGEKVSAKIKRSQSDSSIPTPKVKLN